MIQCGQVGDDVTPFFEEEFISFLNGVEVRGLVDHDQPADCGHDHQDADHHPAVGGEGLENDADIATGQPVGGLLVLGQGEQLAGLISAALVDRRELIAPDDQAVFESSISSISPTNPPCPELVPSPPIKTRGHSALEQPRSSFHTLRHRQITGQRCRRR